jgi:predicted GNAT family N-acyltransferase
MSTKASATIQTRPYRVSDRQACLAIFRSNLPRYFDSSELPEFDAFLEQASGDYFVVEQDSALVACGGCYMRDGKGRLSWGMVAQERHGASLGSTLLAWRVNHLFLQPGTAEITINISQHTADFFARYGFRTTQQISDGLGMGIDQISMSLQRDDWQAGN